MSRSWRISKGFDPIGLSSGVLRRMRSAVAMYLLKLSWLVLGTAAYLGLAVFGRGGLAEFFSHPALIALAVVFFALTDTAFFAGGNLCPGVREDRSSQDGAFGWCRSPPSRGVANGLEAGC